MMKKTPGKNLMKPRKNCEETLKRGWIGPHDKKEDASAVLSSSLMVMESFGGVSRQGYLIQKTLPFLRGAAAGASPSG